MRSVELEKPSYKCEFDGTNHEYLERVGWSSRCVIMRVPPSLTFVRLQIPRCCFGGFIVITSDQNWWNQRAAAGIAGMKLLPVTSLYATNCNSVKALGFVLWCTLFPNHETVVFSGGHWIHPKQTHVHDCILMFSWRVPPLDQLLQVCYWKALVGLRFPAIIIVFVAGHGGWPLGGPKGKIKLWLKWDTGRNSRHPAQSPQEHMMSCGLWNAFVLPLKVRKLDLEKRLRNQDGVGGAD